MRAVLTFSRAFLALLGLALILSPSPATAQPLPPIVISQVYGGAGSASSLYRGDYIELFNRGSDPVDITGWSIQYASASGSFGQSVLMTELPSVIIPPGRYFLFKVYSPNTAVGSAIGEDASATSPVQGAGVGINLSGTAGKIALVNTTTLLPTAGCILPNGAVVDFLGYGTSNCAEGGAGAPPLTVNLAVFRANGGCTDTDSNQADFGAATPAPRNSATPLRNCAVTNPTGVGVSSPATQCTGLSVQLSVTVTPGTNPASTGIAVTGDFTALGGGPGNAFASQGGGVYTAAATLSTNLNTPRDLSVPVSISDAQGRTGLATIVVSVIDCSLRATAASIPPGVCNGEPAMLTVTVTPAQTPASTGVTVAADLSAIGGDAAQAFVDDGTSGDALAGDQVYSFTAVVPAGTPDGPSTLPVVIADAQGRSASASLTITHGACTDSQASVVISQIYGGGGNTGTTFRQDFVELFNRSSAPVDLSTWSLQYASIGGEFTASLLVPLTGVIQPGSYYLVGQAFGAGGTTDIPQSDVDGFIAMSAIAGKLALVRDQIGIGADCASPAVVDLVAYGQVASCVEGLAGAPGTNNFLAVIRRDGGCHDTNNNVLDFFTGAPRPRNSQSPASPCTPACRTDFNGDGFTDPDDLSDFISCYFGNPPCDRADFNGDGNADPDDLSDYIAQFFSGC